MATKKNTTKSNTNGFSVNLLPKFYQTNANKKFLQATLDQLYQPGTLSKTSGFVGRKNAKASTGKDIYVTAADQTRQNYQLEPAITIKDSLDNITFFKDYQDYINQVGVFGGITNNHARLNEQEFYSWDPHIEWDKFVNFQNYYWLPYGPDVITVYGHEIPIQSTYTVKVESEGSNNQYVFSPDGFTPNPVLVLYEGQTYTFVIDSPNNPFSIKTARTTGKTDRYQHINAIDNYAVESGTITFTVPVDAPTILYYQSENDINLGGTIQIYSKADDTTINVEAEIIGKTNYTLTNGTVLSNGMKLVFKGQVEPASYAVGQYYVEGVGTAIKLVLVNSLEIISPFTVSQDVEFDNLPFDKEPFDNASGYAGQLDYITINRSGKDKNPWSRYNRWFHKDVITASAVYNNNVPELDQTARAKRPIIEFVEDIRLFNFGTHAIEDIDLIDTFTSNVFSTIEGSAGYNIDGVQLRAGMLVIFTADQDPLVKDKTFKVEYIDVKHINGGSNQLHLVEISSPVVDQSVLVQNGVGNQGSTYWYTGTEWKKAQQKTKVNQPPLFDVYDSEKISFGDLTKYVGSTFIGTPIFSYKLGSGANDVVLGFPLSYLNVNNIGDIVFNFNLATDTFNYKNPVTNAVQSSYVDTGFLSVLDYNGVSSFANGWQLCTTKTVQAGVRVYDNSGLINNFDIDIFDDINNLDDLIVKVYVNGLRLDTQYWSVVSSVKYKTIQLTNSIELNDVLTIKTYAKQPINATGYYEIPLNLESNPLNEDIGDFTLGEVKDHVNSIIDNIPMLRDLSTESSATQTTSGQTYDPDHPNIRDLGNITQYGTKFVQHSGPLSLAIYHIASESFNVIKAIDQSKIDYNNFKRLFINTAGSLGVHGDPVTTLELIMNKINANKPKVAPYYLSDMVPYGATVTTVLNVVDRRIRKYPLTTPFNLTSLSNKAIGIYLNGFQPPVGRQLVYGLDYTFDEQGFVVITNRVVLTDGDTITTVEYDSTDGSFVPATPTKLGMWPKYEPKKYLDTTLINPVNVIQGHDGSVMLAYNDYRDDLILELEKRIFNNIKVTYNKTIFDVTDIIPSYNRTTLYSREEFNDVLSPNFYNWVGLIGKDLTTPLNYDRTNSFTYNYSLNTTPDGKPLPGYWRGVYRWVLDTDRPNICPWEMLGFSIKPAWWQGLYGSAPYTSDNIPMWKDIASGIIREPGKPVVADAKYAKPFLNNHIPVDSNGNLISPLSSGLATGLVEPNIDNNFIFGDGSPVENAWTRSSYYPFSVISTALLLQPAKVFGILLDRNNTTRNLAGQLIYTISGLRIRPKDVILPSVYSSKTRVQTAGLINYVVDLIFNYIFSNDVKAYNNYLADLSAITPRLSYRVGAFTNQDQFNLLLESKTPSSKGNVFIPTENYKVFLNKSSPVSRLTYSGVIITKVSTGFEIKGYSITQPYFKYYQYTGSGVATNVGGISESYMDWTPGQQYIAGSVVHNNGKFYRAISNATAGNTLDIKIFIPLPSLPMTGGVTAIMRTNWDRTDSVIAPYGTMFETVQQVVDFLLGYGEYLKDQGFVFDDYNNNLNTVSNWGTSTREFLFWSTQNWSAGQDKWSDWDPTKSYNYATIVRYEGDYYSAIQNIPQSNEFEYEKWNILPGLNIEGASVISLSPGANSINFNTNLSVVDNIGNGFNTYEIFKVNGTPFEITNLDSYRQGNSVTYTPRTADGIYGASFYLVQHEHVIIIDNTTIFNDVIYSPTSGYRQERLKVSGYLTTGWYGGLDIPGFIFDSAIVKEWQTWQDYNIGDVVSYQSYYYSADMFIAGSPTFNPLNWTKLDKKPAPQILPNWTNIATQFTDFYSLDVDSFNSAQQTMAQHLIGYQKRQYLNNIIQDDVSEFKFYQGMIREKGTQNVLNQLFGVLNSENKESLTFYEEWALRVGQYGAVNGFEAIEFVLDETKYANNPQGTLLTQSVSSNVNPFIIQQTINDVYVKPLGYNSSPFPILPTNIYTIPDPTTGVQVSTSVNQFLRSAGYVDPSDVFVSLGHLSDVVSHPATKITVGISYKILTAGTTDFTKIGSTSNDVGATFIATGTGAGTGTVTLDITQINEGAYFWCAFDGANSWNVYRFTDIHLRVTGVEYTNGVLTITTLYDAPISAGSYVGISQAKSIQGFYKVDNVSLNKITILAPGLKAVPSPFTQIDSLTVYTLVSQRTDYIDNIDTILPSKLDDGNIIWTDVSDYTTNNWASWKYKKVYESATINSPVAIANTQFAKFISVNKIGNMAAVSVGTTQIATYDKLSSSVNWTQRQLIQPPFNRIGNLASTTTVSAVAISPDGTWMATGSPTVGFSSTDYIGAYSSSNTYLKNDIVSYQGKYYQALYPVPPLDLPTQSSVFWNQIFYIPVSSTASHSTNIANNGMITLYQKDANNNYQFVDSILSPSISSEQFGSNLIFDNTNLYISATNYGNNLGRVYKLSYKTIPQVTSIYDEVNSVGSVLKLTSTSGISAGMTVSGFDVLGKNPAFTSNQVVVSVLTRLLFVPVTGAINNILNISSTSINLSKITVGSTVDLYQNSYNFNLPDVRVTATGLTSLNVLSATRPLLSGGAVGANTFNLLSATGVSIGYLVVGKGIPTGGYVGAITTLNGSYKITLVDFVGAIQNFIVQGSGDYQFYKIVNYSFVEVSSQKDLTNGPSALPVTTAKFNSDTTLTFSIYTIQSSNAVVLSAPPDLTPKGAITFSSTSWAYDTVFTGTRNLGQTGDNYFGNHVGLSADGSTVAITAYSGNLLTDTPNPSAGGVVHVYKNDGTVIQTLTSLSPDFGKATSFSDDASYLVINNNIQLDSLINNVGNVGVYKLNSATGQYSLLQNLIPHAPEDNQEFGTKLSFMNDSKTLVVYSQNGSSTIVTTYDESRTTYDKKSTNFITTQLASGRVDVYDRYNLNWVFSESLAHSYNSISSYGQGFAVGANNIFVGAPTVTINSNTLQGQLAIYSKSPSTLSWNIDKTAVDVVDISKVKNAFLYDKTTSTLLTYIDVIDPLQGKIAGPAEEEIKFKTFYDPATYSYSTASVEVTVNDSASWSSEQRGQLWWDLRTTKFKVPYFKDPAYRNNTWNELAPGASVDVYEWVASSLLPSQWDTQSATPAGKTVGITGTTLYGDNAYCVTKTYNSTTKTFKNTYYYWVKNKTNVPSIEGRYISAESVATLIANPRGQGYTYLSLIGINSYSLVNISQYLNDKNTVLAIEYWTTDKIHQNIHSQWKLISADDIVQIPNTIKQKWIDSLCGVDEAGRAVPDVNLPVKLQYGIENRPRQSMFVNRSEALKEVMEGINELLQQQQIIENFNISDLYLKDVEPNIITGLYDKAIDTSTELAYANINLFVRPTLTPVITNGRITDIIIIETGRGYLQAPYIQISGTGQDALVRAKIDTLGRIQDFDIISSGIGYDDNTTVSVRDYSVLVHSDSQAAGAWSIYSFDPTYVNNNDSTVGIWSRTLTQSFDVTQYWHTTDWYDTGYNQFTAADFSVQIFVDLNFITTNIGDIVKVVTASPTQWMLLEKYANSTSADWTQSYKVIGVQDGTIQFNSSIYQTDFSAVGYDASTFDSGAFDVKASTELRIILNTLQNKILTGVLYKNYLDIFFRSIRYAHSEQPYLDWIFKTSFVRATHNVGGFTQPVYYPVDNLSNFQDYVNEVKPYRTKVREYISQYTNTTTPDLNPNAVTDFDLPSAVTNNALNIVTSFIVNGEISVDTPAIQTYPWKFWADNLGFKVVDLQIVSGGSKYVTAPEIIFNSNSGSGAKAQVFFTNGVINRIILQDSGSGYLSAPTIEVKGGLAVGGTPARIVAIIGDGVVRSNLTAIKFDRIGQTTYINDINATETIYGTGSQLTFDLTWPPSIQVGKSSVTVLNTKSLTTYPMLREMYKLIIVNSKINGATYSSGKITFTTALTSDEVATVSYIKDITILNAADRINFYYNPNSGMIGKELNQLMTGIDYGGTIVGNLGFNTGGGWDALPFNSDKWDSFDPEYSDYKVTQTFFPTVNNPLLHTWTLPYVSDSGIPINVYWGEYITTTFDGTTDISVDGVTDYFPYSLFLYPTVVLTFPLQAISSISATTTLIAPVNSYPISTTIVAVAKSLAGNVGQSSILVDNASNIVAGQFISGTGVPYNTTVIQVTNLQITLSQNLTASSVDQLYEFFTLGTILTVASTAGIVANLGVVGTGFDTQTVTKLINTTSLILSGPPSLIPTIGATVKFIKNSAGSTVLTIDNTVNLTVGDIVYSETFLEAFGYEAKIASIDSSTQLTLDQIILKNIPDNTALTFKRNLVDPIDINTRLAGFIIFRVPPPVGSVVNIVGNLDPIRIDDPYYGTPLDPLHPELPHQTNPDAVMNSLYITGTSGVVSIPSNFPTKSGDIFIFRKQTSDGTIAPADRDTDISGGDLAYSTARGILADDIILDGDGLVTPTSSPAPEEVVPGQVVDTLAIRVFDRPNSGSAKIKVDNYVANGSTVVFSISQQPVTINSIVVKVTGTTGATGIQTLNTDYSINYQASTVTFNVPPADGSIVSIFNIGYAGENILDLDYFVGDGNTTEFITKAPWLDMFTAAIFVDGVPQTVEYFQTDTNYILVKSVGIRFVTPPPINSLINYIIVSGDQPTFAITNTERIYPSGAKTYSLQNLIGNLLPNETYMIVRVNQQILPAPVNSYFTIGQGNFAYTLSPNKIPPYSLETSAVSVLVGNDVLLAGRDYYVDIGGVTINITTTAYTTYLNQTMVISVLLPNGYTYNASRQQITFAQTYNSSDVIEILSSYQHNTLDLQRTELIVEATTALVPDSSTYYTITNTEGGLLILERPVIDENYVWVTKNSTLLIPGVDYRLNDDLITIQLAKIPVISDVFEIMTFGSTILKPSIAYVQFKDMLNRTSYSRLSAEKQTRLAEPLLWTDTSMVLADASNFQEPNIADRIPGVIEIQGERIEYYAKTGNVLSQLRRSILGTGIAKSNPAGTYVQDIGSAETIPYQDTISYWQIPSDGTNYIDLEFTPDKGSSTDPSGIVNWFKMFGYTYTGVFSSAATYGVNNVVNYNGTYYYTVKSILAVSARLPNIDYSPATVVSSATPNAYWKVYPTTIPPGYGQNNSLDVFVGGYISAGNWAPGISYIENAVVNVGSYTYRCVTAHTSSDAFKTDRANWSFFVGNIHLKKTPYTVFNINEGPKSPEGDVKFDADFSVNGSSSQIRLTNKLDITTQVTVYKRTGVDWDGKQTPNILDDTSLIANFIKAKPGIWYAQYNQISNTTLGGKFNPQLTFDSSTSFDDPNLTMDQG